ncbi:uncharacterized protein DUF397 [Herbihabitans rhizosphaerae]|uniref:Uncharacterized protein DUF397 n=1 Tax=Herbihabitans rhizosphaerae TaxID=1872711 RepID=A0A4Q7KP07_9PSEU|nr:DUF397 domain-containing protein [Herbihabitans rhizosphaerae]RZS36972.1 uncharacterized protein DUF397 [Herbihabitans rhizosphaerae]
MTNPGTLVPLEFSAWRKSSFSEGNNNECVEIAFAWRKSSFSEPNNNDCVEIAHSADAVGVRDSKSPAHGALVLPPSALAALTEHIR